MVFIVYGWANKRRGIAGELEAGHCEGCGTSRGFRKRVTYKVRHISWLVRWVTERRYERVCETCGRGEWISPKITQQGLKRPGIPIWDRYGWAGSLAAVALLLTTAFMADEADHRRYDALLAAPAAGDLYELDLAQVVQRPPMPTMKAIVKVDRVEGGQVANEIVGVFRLDPVSRQPIGRKVVQVDGHNHRRAGTDRRRQDVAIVRVR